MILDIICICKKVCLCVYKQSLHLPPGGPEHAYLTFDIPSVDQILYGEGNQNLQVIDGQLDSSICD